MELQGSVKKIGETQTFGSNGFAKRELVITTEDQYPQHISIEFLQDNVDYLDNYAEGQNVKVGINLRGREWVSPQGETKYFNSIVGWRIDLVATESQKPTQQQAPPLPEDDEVPY